MGRIASLDPYITQNAKKNVIRDSLSLVDLDIAGHHMHYPQKSERDTAES